MFHQNLSQHNLNEVYLGQRIKKTMDLLKWLILGRCFSILPYMPPWRFTGQ